MRNHTRRFGLIAAMMLCLASCAGRRAMPATSAQAATIAALQAGDIHLPCGRGCAAQWKQQAPALRQLDAEEKWEELAARVRDIGYGSDVAFYYLGQCAQGLGFHQAAIGYYTRALAVAGGNAGRGLLNAVPVLIQASRDALSDGKGAKAAN